MGYERNDWKRGAEAGVLLAVAYLGGAWSALGYDSWEAYVEAEFQDANAREIATRVPALVDPSAL